MVRHTFGDLESQKQVCFGYGVKNRITGAAATINPPHPPKKKNGKQSETKGKKREKRGLEPTHLESYCCCKQYIYSSTHSPTHSPKKRTHKSEKTSTKTAKRGLEPAHLTSYCCKQYIAYSTAVQWYMWYCCKKGTLLPLRLQYVQNRTILKATNPHITETKKKSCGF